MSFDHTKIKTININFNTGSWNPETHNIVLEYDPTTTSGFSIKFVKTEIEPTEFHQATELLNKIRNKLK